VLGEKREAALGGLVRKGVLGHGSCVGSRHTSTEMNNHSELVDQQRDVWIEVG
jgi:hypothetical protein